MTLRKLSPTLHVPMTAAQELRFANRRRKRMGTPYTAEDVRRQMAALDARNAANENKPKED